MAGKVNSGSDTLKTKDNCGGCSELFCNSSKFMISFKVIENFLYCYTKVNIFVSLWCAVQEIVISEEGF